MKSKRGVGGSTGSGGLPGEGVGTQGSQGSQRGDVAAEPEFVDRVSRKVDVNRLRVTQLPYNPNEHWMAKSR